MGRRTFVLAAALAAAFAFAGLAQAQEVPAPVTFPPAPPTVAAGVTVAGIDVAGMTAVEAAAALRAVFDQPMEFVFRKRRWQVSPAKLGGKAAYDPAVGRALGAQEGAEVELPVRIRGKSVRKYVSQLHRKYSAEARDAELKLVNFKPRYKKAKNGIEIDRLATTKQIVSALKDHTRTVELAYDVVEPEVSETSKAPVVVVKRGSKKLLLYSGKKLVRSFRVAVGQAAYPTPLGRFDIINKQVNPTWTPPNSDWARGLAPVGPGPGNPLGTRWMGLSSPLIGVHGTYDAASVGTNASHGCIRMHVSEAEWLFDNVDVGTPIWVVGA